jgi:hypothetical protein
MTLSIQAIAVAVLMMPAAAGSFGVTHPAAHCFFPFKTMGADSKISLFVQSDQERQ